MAPYGTIWHHMVPYGTIWYHVVPYGTIWYHMVPYGTHMAPYGTIRYHMIPYGTIWQDPGSTNERLLYTKGVRWITLPLDHVFQLGNYDTSYGKDSGTAI